jgi:hypothetical protein
MIFRDQ